MSSKRSWMICCSGVKSTRTVSGFRVVKSPMSRRRVRLISPLPGRPQIRRLGGPQRPGFYRHHRQEASLIRLHFSALMTLVARSHWRRVSHMQTVHFRRARDEQDFAARRCTKSSHAPFGRVGIVTNQRKAMSNGRKLPAGGNLLRPEAPFEQSPDCRDE